MGQVWSKGNFDGIDEVGAWGGRGSVLAVTAQNPGADGIEGTSDDLLVPMNQSPASVSIDVNVDNNCTDNGDRIRGFHSVHSGGAHFSLADGSTRFINENIDMAVYQAISTIRGDETVGKF